MAVYRKKLVDKDGNTIIPAIGDIYGPVYTASLQSSSGGIATYTFTPDTPVEANRVYAVKFPDPSVNNAVILLGDGNMTASSILLPPVGASDNPSYELAYTYNINDTEVWLLMYTGSQQWVCLNQKKPIPVDDITNLITPVQNSWTSRNDIKMYRYGNVIVLRFYQWWVASISANSACNLGTINTSVLGSMAPFCGSMEIINGDNGYIMNHGFIYINSSGKVNAYCPSARSGATSMRGSLTWIYA